MGEYVLGIFLMVSFVAILTWMAVEVNAWRRGRQILSPRQLRIRVINGSLLLAVLALIFAGRFLVEWRSALSEILYWLGIMVMVLVIALVAIIDWRAVLKVREEKSRQIYEDFVDTVERAKGEGGGDREEC
ncbi:MAG: hypothetical protein ACE5R4_11740 [Armatimonadota bacterium]